MRFDIRKLATYAINCYKIKPNKHTEKAKMLLLTIKFPLKWCRWRNQLMNIKVKRKIIVSCLLALNVWMSKEAPVSVCENKHVILRHNDTFTPCWKFIKFWPVCKMVFSGCLVRILNSVRIFCPNHHIKNPNWHLIKLFTDQVRILWTSDRVIYQENILLRRSYLQPLSPRQFFLASYLSCVHA